jgi:hypothetical protein
MNASIIPYGQAINDALKRSDVSIGELLTLRHHAQAILHAQGDLAGALRHLDSEISRRQSK